jgi:guanylate kinase
MSEKGKLLVISGPSGAGKSTVVFKAMETRDDACFSTSVTTRKPRPGETDGKEYFFVDHARFQQMVEQDELLEHATYVSHSYGTPRQFVEDKLNAGINVVLDIEVQGARQVSEKMPEAIKIFFAPPSLEELERRLTGRGTETPEAVRGRLERARQEYAEADFYDYLIVNDDVDHAAGELNAIITAEHCHFSDRSFLLKDSL